MFICKSINHIFITAWAHVAEQCLNTYVNFLRFVKYVLCSDIGTAYSDLFQGVKQPCFGASVAVCVQVLV